MLKKHASKALEPPTKPISLIKNLNYAFFFSLAHEKEIFKNINYLN